MTELAKKHCEACAGGTPRLTDDQVRAMMPEIPGWDIQNGKLVRDVKLKNFKGALALANQIGDLAEDENHHPDIHIHDWNHVRVELVTHSIGGLSENDAIMAAKITGLINRTAGVE